MVQTTDKRASSTASGLATIELPAALLPVVSILSEIHENSPPETFLAWVGSALFILNNTSGGKLAGFMALTEAQCGVAGVIRGDTVPAEGFCVNAKVSGDVPETNITVKTEQWARYAQQYMDGYSSTQNDYGQT